MNPALLLRVNGIDQLRKRAGGRRAFLELWTAFCDCDRVDRKLFWFAMKGELKPVGQEPPQHRHLFVKVWLDVARRRGENIVAVGIGPGRRTGNSAGTKTVPGRNQRIEREAFGIEPVDALHPNVPSRRINGRLDGRDFERSEFGPRGWGLSKKRDGRKKQPDCA